MRTSYDAVTPQPNGIPGTDTVLIYSGGDTPHVWTNQEIAEQPERWRVPTWVRSFAGVDPTTDAQSFLAWLSAHNAPLGTATVLDLETLVDVPFVQIFGQVMNRAGYKVLPYGSRSTLFQNPQLDGYFTAHPGATTIDPGCVATQYGYYNDYDLSWFLDSVPLWDTKPAPAPQPGVDETTTFFLLEV